MHKEKDIIRKILRKCLIFLFQSGVTMILQEVSMVDGKINNGVLRICLTGELDDHSAPTMRKQLDSMIDDRSIKRVVIDMSRLDFMDSTGIGVLLGRYKKLAASGVSAFILSPKNNVDKVLNLSGIYKLMPKI